MINRYAVLVIALLVAAALAFLGYDGWAIAVAGFGLLFLGWTVMLPLLYVFGVVLLSALALLLMYLPRWYFGDELLSDFLDDIWFVFPIYLAAGIGSYWYMKRASEETWQIIRDHHATASPFLSELDQLSTAGGFLTFQEELLPVGVALVQTGFVLVRPSGEAVHVPWKNIQEIAVHDDNSYTQAYLTLSRTLVVGIPWRAAFEADVPDDFKLAVNVNAG